jgi:hypothetical protein
VETSLVIAGGVINLLFVIFHLLFWELFKWPASLSGLDKRQAAIMQVLNIHLTIALALFALVSLVFPRELLTVPLGRCITIFIAGFWFLRAFNQYLFWGASKAASHLLFFVCFVNGLLYLVALLHFPRLV